MKKKSIFVLVTLLFVSGLVGGFLFLFLGIYDIAASRPHTLATKLILTQLKRHSVERRAESLRVPPLNQAERIQRGFFLYQKNCVQCHGAPGVSQLAIGRGLNPSPKRLEHVLQKWSPKEIGWIISNGLKMAGMPAFALGERPDDIWALTAFVVRLNTLTPREYRSMLKVTSDQTPKEGRSGEKYQVLWETPKPRSFPLGNGQRGKALLKEKGCTSCHIIEGIGRFESRVGPPLVHWSKRHYLAGKWINNRSNLIDWLQDPEKMEPGTAMPNLGLTEQQAIDMATYLFST